MTWLRQIVVVLKRVGYDRRKMLLERYCGLANRVQCLRKGHTLVGKQRSDCVKVFKILMRIWAWLILNSPSDTRGVRTTEILEKIRGDLSSLPLKCSSNLLKFPQIQNLIFLTSRTLDIRLKKIYFSKSPRFLQFLRFRANTIGLAPLCYILPIYKRPPTPLSSLTYICRI